MALKFRRGTAAQQSGSLIFGEPYINTDLNTLLLGGNGTQIQLLNISGGISSSLLPSTGSTFDLGSLTRPWQHLYVASASIKFVDGAGTQVASLSAQQVNSLISGTGSYATTGSNTFNGNQTISASLIVNSTNATLGQFVGNQNGYVEFSVRNTSTGISASGDIAVYADNGTVTTNYIDMGINNSGVTQSVSYAGAFIGDALDGYLYNVGGDLWIGNASTSSKNIHIFNTGSARPMITITPDTVQLTGSLNVINGGITGSIAATNGVVSGSSQVITILSSLNTYTSSNDTTNTTQNNRLTNLETTSASVNISITNINSFTASNANTSLNTYTGSVSDPKFLQIAASTSSLNAFTSSASLRLTNLETTSASVNGYIADNNSKTGSYVKNNIANTFNGNQIISGALTITQDLVVLGSSSIQNISSSNVTIGSAYITLNAFSPSSRFAGLRVIDSGSTGGSGSFLYDAVDDEWIFVHKGNGTNITSSHVVMGPETYDNLGNEIYMTSNRIPKVTNYEHLGDSNISDTGTEISLNSLTSVTGSLRVSNAITASAGLMNGTLTLSGDLPRLYLTDTVHNDDYSIINQDGVFTIYDDTISTAKFRIYTNGVTELTGNTVVTGSLLTTNGITGSIAATNGVVSGSSQVVGILSSLNTYTGSNDTTNTTQNTRLSRLEESTSSLNTLTGSLATTYEGRASATKTIVSGSSQITLSSTTGGGTTANVQFGSLGIGMAASGTSGRIDASGDIIAFSTSDKNFKENIIPIPNALEKISKISGNIYDWKSELKEYHGFEGNDVGVIAQEIEEILPQLVTTRENGYKAVKYDKLVALLIEGIKEQQIQINELKAQIGSK